MPKPRAGLLTGGAIWVPPKGTAFNRSSETEREQGREGGRDERMKKKKKKKGKQEHVSI